MLLRHLIGVTALMLATEGAHAYRYEGPSKVICRGLFEPAGCSIQPSSFGMVSIRVPNNPPDNLTLLTITPKASSRGSFVIRQVRFKLKQTVPSSGTPFWQLAIERDIFSNDVSKTITYIFQDHIAVSNYGGLPTGMTIFMSDTAGWVESYANRSSLSFVTTIPVFFGYGPAESATFNVQAGGKSPTDYAAVEEGVLYSSIAAHYNAATIAPNQPGSSYPLVYVQPPYPFSRQGNRRKAAALLSVF